MPKELNPMYASEVRKCNRTGDNATTAPKASLQP